MHTLGRGAGWYGVGCKKPLLPRSSTWDRENLCETGHVVIPHS